jgi:hypothetical protein
MTNPESVILPSKEFEALIKAADELTKRVLKISKDYELDYLAVNYQAAKAEFVLARADLVKGKKAG